MRVIILPILVLMSVFALAQKNKRDSTKNKELQEVTIEGSIIKTPKISKNGITEMDLPQAITILDGKTLQQQQISNLTDVLKNVNGVYIMGTTGGYQEEIASRGSNISSTNTFKNGIRFFNGMKIEMSGIDKIEVLKGNTAIEYGNVAPGGVLNIITKKPKFEFGGNIDFTYASFNNFKPQIDVFGPLNKSKTIAFRLNSSYQQGNSFRKYVESNSFYINPSLLFKINPKSTLLIEGDFTKSSTVPDFGAGIINYQIVDLPRDRFTGVSWGRYNANQSFLSAKYNISLNKRWDLSALVGYRNYGTELFANARPSSTAVLANGNWKRSIQKSEVGDDYTIQQIDANVLFKTGRITHKVLIGADAEQFTTQTTAYNNFANYDSINIYNEYNANNETNAPNLTKNTLTKTPINRFGVYAQNLISFPKYVKIFIGGRYNYVQSQSEVLTYSTNKTVNTETFDKPFSPKVGIILQPTINHTIFSSYSNSFALNTGVDINGNAIKPSIIDQYEIGVKNRFLNGKMQLNATVYLIVNSNLAQTSLLNGNTNSNIKELAGETESKGIEIDGMYKPIKGLSIMAGYSYNQSTYTKSNTFIVGSELRYNPNHTANASVNYEIAKGKLKNLNVGLISQYFGNRFAGRSTRLTVANDIYRLIPVNDYFVLDLVAGYKYKNWRLNGKLANVLNEMSYNIHDDNSLNPIAPINYSVQVGLTF